MRSIRSHAFVAVVSLLSCLVTPGCGDHDIIDPVLEIPEKRSLVVVPFRDEQFANGFESPRGCDLAESVMAMLRDKGEFRVLNKEKVLALYNENDPKTLTARDVAEKTGADYVLMGDVIHWGLRDDNTFGGLLRGSATIEVSIYETAAAAAERAKTDKEKDDLPAPGRGRIAIAKKRVNALFPREYGMADVGTYQMTEVQVEDGLKTAASQAVAWLLISHSKEEEKLAGGK